MTISDTKQINGAHESCLTRHSVTTKNNETKSPIHILSNHGEINAQHIIDYQ